jgi:Bacterial mobilisation protein (MobC)
MPSSPIKDREIKFTVRLSIQEAATFKENAQRAGMSRSAYLRSALTKGKIAVTNVPETNELMAGLLAGLITEIRRLGNNVNQMARSLNTMSALGVMPEGLPDGRMLKDLRLTMDSNIRDIARMQDDLMGRKKRRRKAKKS